MKHLHTFKKFSEENKINEARETESLELFAYIDIQEAQEALEKMIENNLKIKFKLKYRDSNETSRLDALEDINSTIKKLIKDKSRLFDS